MLRFPAFRERFLVGTVVFANPFVARRDGPRCAERCTMPAATR